MADYVNVSDVYELLGRDGTANIHISDIDKLERITIYDRDIIKLNDLLIKQTMHVQRLQEEISFGNRCCREWAETVDMLNKRIKDLQDELEKRSHQYEFV